MINRPTLLRAALTVLVGALTFAVTFAAAGCSLAPEVVETVGKVQFAQPLRVPPLAESRVDPQGRRIFELHAQSGRQDFGRGRPTATWGFNGDYLGPTLRAGRGEDVQVNVSNGLGEQTSVHWHGMHLPAAMDGGPHQPVSPGGTWSPTWRVDQPAATLWYHPHPHGATETHVYRGLAGLFILDDERSGRVQLPKRYGVDDFPLIVQDRRFNDAGQFSYERGQGGTGILGDTLLVNGTVGPYLEVTTQRVRLRLLNASNARIYDFGLSDGRSFALVGTDGGLLPAPHQANRIRLSPAERAEIVVELRPGERVDLRSYPTRLGVGSFGDAAFGGTDRFDVLQLRAAAVLKPSPELPASLAPVQRIDPAAATTTRTFRLTGQVINGRPMSMDRIDATIERGATEVWNVVGQDGTPHNFHVHGVQFQVLSVDGAAPPAELRGWKDTVFVPSNATLSLVARFPDYTDPDSPYMYHCHLLFHEDQGMMGQFVVVEPGQQAGRPAASHSGHNHR